MKEYLHIQSLIFSLLQKFALLFMFCYLNYFGKKVKYYRLINRKLNMSLTKMDQTIARIILKGFL